MLFSYIVLPVAGMSERCFEIMAYTRKNDEAVSPVIGVILMVAITVILAAVIAAFVFGMSGNITKTKTVAVTVQKVSAGELTILNNGGQDASTLNRLDVTATPTASTCTGTNTSFTTPTCTYYAAGSIMPVGSNLRLTSSTIPLAFAGRTQVVAVGGFTDGTSQVLLDTFV